MTSEGTQLSSPPKEDWELAVNLKVRSEPMSGRSSLSRFLGLTRFLLAVLVFVSPCQPATSGLMKLHLNQCTHL